MKRVREHFRSNLVAYVALFFALGLGSAWAATELSKNSVKSKHIAPGAVKRSDVARDAINSRKVADGSLRGADFGSGQIPSGPQGATGAQGPTGQAGSTGPQGPTGATGARGPSFGDLAYVNTTNLLGCGGTVLSDSLTVTEPARLYVHAQGVWSRNGTSGNPIDVRLVLSSGATAVGRTSVSRFYNPSTTEEHAFTSGGVMAQVGDAGQPYVLQPGTYTLRLDYTTYNFSCSATSPVPYMSVVGLSHILLGTG